MQAFLVLFWIQTIWDQKSGSEIEGFETFCVKHLNSSSPGKLMPYIKVYTAIFPWT